jgi:hypothetical protein
MPHEEFYNMQIQMLSTFCIVVTWRLVIGKRAALFVSAAVI